MIKKIIRLIHDLRIIFLLLIICGFFGVVGINPVNLTQFFGAKFGQAIGMSVSIPENPFNKLALQLKEKENNLNQREIALDRRERELNNGTSVSGQKQLTFWLMIGIVLLFILVIINYILDYKRRKKELTSRS